MKRDDSILVAGLFFALMLALGGKLKPFGTTAKGKLTKNQLMSLASMVGFPDTNLAAAVAMAESGGDPNAVGVGPKERSVGLWQVNTLAHPSYSEARLKEPEYNAMAAMAIYKSAGNSWKPWGAYTNGSYKKYL